MSKRKTMLALVSCYLGYCAIYIARVNLSIASPALIEAGKLTSAQFGLAGSIFSVCYAIGRLVSGRFNDRKPPWKMLLLGLSATGISNILLGFLPPYLGIFLLCACNAFGQSMLWGSVLRLVAATLDDAVVARVTSYMVTAVSSGTVLGYLLDSFWCEAFGASFTFLLPGVLCLICGGLIFFTTKSVQLTALPQKTRGSISGVVSRNSLLSIIIPTFIHGVLKDNISLWLPAFFVNSYGIDLKNAVWYMVAVPLVGLAGRLLYPSLYKMFSSKENRVSLVGFIICTIASLKLVLGNNSMLVSAICFALIYAAISLINTSMLSIYPLHYVKSGNTATISGFMDLLTYIGAGAGSALFGWLIGQKGYTAMFVVWLAGSVLSSLSLSISNQPQELTTN